MWCGWATVSLSKEGHGSPAGAPAGCGTMGTALKLSHRDVHMTFATVSFETWKRVAVATVNRKLKAGRPMDVSSSERALGLVRLVGQVEQMVEESGNADGFDAPTWLGKWLDRPLPALGGKTPGEFMDTTPGQELVSHLLAQAQSGAYA